jgi:uncharacterized protein (TIGR03437 family)
MMKLASAILLTISAGSQAFAQATTPTLDSTGNSMLSGTYYFREVIWEPSASYGGALAEAYAFYGSVNFSGSGTYTISAQLADLQMGQLSTQNVSGTYSIGAGGFGIISHPLFTGVVIRGMVSNGIFIGSATETGGVNDLFIAGLIPSPAPGLSTFNGSYSMSYVNYSDVQDQNSIYYFAGAQFTLNPNGAGSLGNVSIRGYYSGNGTTVTGQVSNGLKYTASNGAMVLPFPTNTSATLISGNEYLYFSPDGNFVFGGSPVQADMMIGVKTSAGGAPQLLSSALYYNAGLFSDATNLASGGLDIDSYYGSFSVSSGAAILHQRIFSILSGSASDSVLTESVPTTPGATYTDGITGMLYTIGNGGNVRIGFGVPPQLGIDVALAAPAFNGTGVYLNPVGVLNAGSYAPFTAGVSPGELLTLFGTNLAPSTQVASTAIFPTKLNNVQVLIDGIPAPIYYVSATQIAAIVPYAASTFPVATIQVKNSSGSSNIVTALVSATTPGVQTYPTPNGISVAAAVRYDASGRASIVAESNPAQPGDTVSIYLTGLGAVFPPIQDGFPGSSDSSNLNNATNNIVADLDGTAAKVGYAGLAPGATGQYQLNITIPTGLTTGDNYLGIGQVTSSGLYLTYSSEALLPIGNAGSSAVAPIGTEEQNSQPNKTAKGWNSRPHQKHVVVNPDKP